MLINLVVTTKNQLFSSVHNILVVKEILSTTKFVLNIIKEYLMIADMLFMLIV